MQRHKNLRHRRLALQARLATTLQVQGNRTAKQARLLRRKLARVDFQLKQRKVARTRAILRTARNQQRHHRQRCRKFKMATWNTRGLGAPTGNINQELKIKCFLKHMVDHDWTCAVLTDLKFRENGVRRYTHNGQTWFLVIHEKVGFLMDAWCREWWLEGGSVIYHKGTRAVALSLPRRGWRRGLYILGVYAPTSDSGIGERRLLRQEIEILRQMAPATSLHILAGDFNAEFGNNADTTIAGHDSVGCFGTSRLTTIGREWRQWFSRFNLRDLVSRYRGRNRHTWIHPRFQTQHELDHILCRAGDLWHVQHGRILVEGPSVTSPWTPYTDHNPVELTLRFGKQWTGSARSKNTPKRPDLTKLRGHGHEQDRNRQAWTQGVEARLRTLQPFTNSEEMDQNWNALCRICREVAVEVCGVIESHRGAPWLRNRAADIERLDAAIQSAKQQDQYARATGDAAQCRVARYALQHARKHKAHTLQTWESTWLSEKAEEANAALSTPNVTDIFKIVKHICTAVGVKTGDGGQRHATNAQEAEAWKEHFEQIQAGSGTVDPSVWEDIECLPVQPEFGDPPTWEEYQRVIRDMRLGKAGGEDTMTAEYLKLAGPRMESQVFDTVLLCWRQASQQGEGPSGHDWPSAWRKGIIIPLWKKKGDRNNRNTWRGITLLSAGSKVMARICALRLSRWCAPWLNPLQFGFRAGSGVDDIQQLSRRLLEEAAQSQHGDTYLFRFFDLEKVYPKVVRHGLWQVLVAKGCPPTLLHVLQAIHDSTSSYVHFQGFEFSSFTPGRGLREGCPSSPILFNIYHSAIMEVFRKRRARLAATAGHEVGIPWVYKVDGRVAKRKTDREEEGRNIKKTRFGDMAYADDTAIMGQDKEVLEAEGVLIRTINHFDGKVNQGKTEGLRVSATATDHLRADLGEANTVKHVGAVLSDRAHHVPEIRRVVNKGIQRVEEISRAWLGGTQNRQRRRILLKSVRVKVLKAVVKGVLNTFSRTRAWQTNHIHRMHTVINVALRRMIGIRTYQLRRHGISNLILRKMAQWEPFESSVRRASLLWLGHVARMSVEKPQKQALFGWVEHACGKERCPFKQAQWINSCLRHADIPEIDWFRLAQDRNAWTAKIMAAFPPERVEVQKEREFNRWKVGAPIPVWARPTELENMERQYDHSEDEMGQHRHGNLDNAEPGSYGRERRPRRDRRQRAPPGPPTCPVCNASFSKHNQLAFHYEAEHSVCSPTVTTVQRFSCSDCQQTFRRVGQRKAHVCPAKCVLPRLTAIDALDHVGGPSCELAPPIPLCWHLFTDG